MVNERDRNRALYPDFAFAIDEMRRLGWKIDAAWIENPETGAVIAGNRPRGAHDGVEYSADAWIRHHNALAENRRLREEATIKRQKRGFRS